MIEVDKTLSDVDTARDQLLQLLAPAGTVMDLNIGAALWFAVEAAGKLRLPADTTLSHLDGQQYTSQVGSHIRRCNVNMCINFQLVCVMDFRQN